MTWDGVLKIIMATLASVGGISAVIVLAVKYSADFIAERLEERYSLKLSKELEKYKSCIESKTYISKAKFDAEFALYRELSKAFCDAVKAVSIMIPAGLAFYPDDKEVRKKVEEQHYDEALKASVVAQDTLRSNIPFIPKNIYDLYSDILADCMTQLRAFEERWNVSFIGHELGESTLEPEDYQRTKTILDKFDSLNEQVREYISGLDILE